MRLLSLIEAHPASTPAALREMAGVPQGTAAYALQTLEKRGLIVCQRLGRRIGYWKAGCGVVCPLQRAHALLFKGRAKAYLAALTAPGIGEQGASFANVCEGVGAAPGDRWAFNVIARSTLVERLPGGRLRLRAEARPCATALVSGAPCPLFRRGCVLARQWMERSQSQRPKSLSPMSLLRSSTAGASQCRQSPGAACIPSAAPPPVSPPSSGQPIRPAECGSCPIRPAECTGNTRVAANLRGDAAARHEELMTPQVPHEVEGSPLLGDERVGATTNEAGSCLCPHRLQLGPCQGPRPHCGASEDRGHPRAEAAPVPRNVNASAEAGPPPKADCGTRREAEPQE